MSEGESTARRPAPPTAAKLMLRDVRVEFLRADKSVFRALDSVDLSVREGEFVALVGRSGCGKSTLFNAIAGLVAPARGEILVDGRPVNGVPGHAGYMMQRDLLFPWRRVLDNVLIGLQVLGRADRRARERARALLPRFGLSGYEDAWPVTLSGGMRQRAALLRTMLLERELLLLDEPFGALDAITRGEMQAWLLSIWDEFRSTVLFITHDVEEAAYLADRVVVMAGPPGSILDVVPVDIPRPRDHTSVVTSPELARVKHRVLELIEGNASVR